MATKVQEFLQRNPTYIGYSNTANRTAPAPAPKSKKGSKNKNWLSSIISEVSGAGGALGGAATGAAIGSVVPGIGTLIGGVAGGIAGGFAGGTGGRLVENKVRDDEYRLGDALKEGAISGVLGGVGPAWQGARGLRALSKAGVGKGVGAVGEAGATRLASMQKVNPPELYRLSKLGFVKPTDVTYALKNAEAISGGVAPGARAARGIASGGLDDLTKAARLTGGRNVAERAGNSAYRSTLGIDDILMPGQTKPTTIFKADDLAGEARRIGLKGSPAQMQRQAAVQYNRFNKQVADRLAESTASINTTQLFTNAEKNVMKQLPLKVGTTNTQDELIRTLIQLDDVAVKGKVNATAIHKFKNGLRVDSAFKKLSTGGNLTAKETVDLALWKEADNWIKELAPAAKELTTRQSRLYGLAQGLGRMTRTPGDPKSMVDLGARILSPTIRKGQNAVGRGLMAAGGAQAGLAGAIPGVTKPILKGTAVRGIAGNTLNPSVPPESEGQELMQEDTTLYGPTAQRGLGGAISGSYAPQRQSAYSLEQAMADLANPANASPKAQQQIMDRYEFISKAEAAQNKGSGSGLNITKITGQQYQLAKRGEQSLQQLAQLLQSDPGALQRTATPGRKLPIVGGFISNAARTGDIDAIGYNIAASLLRLETGAAANEGEIRNLMSQIMPRAGDSPQTVQTKLEQLRTAFGGILSTAGDPSAQYQETQQGLAPYINQGAY